MSTVPSVKIVSQCATLRNLERDFMKPKGELLQWLSYFKKQVEIGGYIDFDIPGRIIRYEEMRRLYWEAVTAWRSIHHKRRKKAEDVVFFAEKAANEAFSALKTNEKTHIVWKMEGRPLAKTIYREVMDGRLKMVKEHYIELTPKEAINLYLHPKTSPDRYYIGLDDQGYYYYVLITKSRQLSLIYEGDWVKQEVISMAEKLI